MEAAYDEKILKTYWQLLIMPLLFVPYSYLNSNVIVKWLGCGCPKPDEFGNIIDSFNANDFTSAFWNVTALIVIIISLFNMRYLSNRLSKLVYMLLISAGSIFLAMKFYYLMQWN